MIERSRFIERVGNLHRAHIFHGSNAPGRHTENIALLEGRYLKELPSEESSFGEARGFRVTDDEVIEEANVDERQCFLDPPRQ